MSSKIIKELSDLVADNVITADIASKIEHYYDAKKENTPNKLFIAFGVLGSLLVGLGIILVLAHNWDNFSRLTKTIFAFLPLVIGQIVCGISILKNKTIAWKEASGTFLFFAIGSSMALISQIYNIPGDLRTFLLTWIVLGLSLIYLLKSNALAILYIIFTTYYACYVGYRIFSVGETPWVYFLLMFGIVPHYIMLLKKHPRGNLTSIINWLIPLSLMLTIGTFVETTSLGFLMYILLFCLFYNVGKLPFFSEQSLRRNGFLILGSLGIIIMLLTFSFDGFWWETRLGFQTFEFFLTGILFLLNVIILLHAFNKKFLAKISLFHIVFIVISLLFLVSGSIPLIGTIIINALVLILGIQTVKIGVDKVHFGIMNYGLGIITALIACRFFDTNMSYVIRGILFLAVGAGFFLTNYIMIKKQNKLNLKKSI